MRPFYACFFLGLISASAAEPQLRALLVLGGCCHDYPAQAAILRDGIQARANVQVDVVLAENKSTAPWFPLFEKTDWAKGYDVVIHDECAADVKDATYVQNIINAHKNGVPAVNLHCAMHSFRTGTPVWFEFIGLQSTGHAWKKPISIDFSAAEHPITQGLSNWTTGDEELYNNVKLFPSAKPLALGTQPSSDGKTDTAVVVWTNDYHGTRIFNTSLGHENKTVADERYLNLVVRGLLWSCDQLNPTYLKPYTGPVGKFEKISGDRPAAPVSYEKKGNPPPEISKLSAAQEAAILADVKVAPEFDLSLFASSSAANYPVYVAAAPNGDLFVASDGNGSLGMDPERGRVVRLRDTDRDGRADQVTEFVKSLDSPRGMVWDQDRLYVIHPPHLSCFIDSDGDGRSDSQKTLVSGIAFGFPDRTADHTTNGLSIGIDGWLYIAGGDFGFKEAVGSDGTRLQHRAGGVLRCRLDGSKLEIFATGTRNILETPISPLLDLFARDNTNDGGGWDVRFHHFTGLEDHGYPRMYLNFPDEIIKPLADYGGGSGCGATYLSEPGFPAKWNDAPLTCDWGSGALWRHSVEPSGATFRETAKPEALIKMTRPTDADVDGLSAIYQASWKGATFKWEGPDVGYIVRVTPKGYQPSPLPDFAKISDAELVSQLESPSQVRTLTAQRSLLRRTETPAMRAALLALAGNRAKALPARVAALYALTQRGKSDPAIHALAADPALQRFVLRALADHPSAPVSLYASGLKSSDARTRNEAIIGAARLGLSAVIPQIAALMGDSDPVISHTACRALVLLDASDTCFRVLDFPASTPAQVLGATRVLMRLHQPKVVTGLIERLKTQPTRRSQVFAALCRLHFQEGEWIGDSWGTRPDTRGPYYQPEPWSETPKIAALLKEEIARLTPAELPGFAHEMQRNRIVFNEALDRMIDLAEKDPALLAELTAQLSTAENIPARSIPLLIKVAQGDFPRPTLASAVATLAKTDSAAGCLASLQALAKLAITSDPNKDHDFIKARTSLLSSPTLENHHLALEQLAEKQDGGVSQWADAALITLSARKSGSPEARELSQKAITEGWNHPTRRRQLLSAISALKYQGLNPQVLEALEDPDPATASLAKQVANVLKINPQKNDKSPRVSSLKPDQVLKKILTTKGDTSLGEQLFERQSCTTCHASSLNQAQKGPYLGNIAQTYTREVLAESIIDPQKTIAQGFATESFTLKDGSSQVGFVTAESATEVKARTISGQEFTWKTEQIASRTRLPNSLMPSGLVNNLTLHEFASLLDYLESLAKK